MDSGPTDRLGEGGGTPQYRAGEGSRLLSKHQARKSKESKQSIARLLPLINMLCFDVDRGPLTVKEREERRLRKELEKAKRLLSDMQSVTLERISNHRHHTSSKCAILCGCRGPLTDKEREERRLRKELEKAERLLSKHQARESKENEKQAEKDERDKAREVARRNASRMAMEDLQVRLWPTVVIGCSTCPKPEC